MANVDGTTDRVTSQSSERIDFYCDHEEADTKMFLHFKFLFENIRLNRVIITFLDAIWFKTGTGDENRCIPRHLLVSELGLPICCLLPAMHAISGCDSVSIPNTKKQNRPTDRYDRLR